MACVAHHWSLRRGAQRGRHQVVVPRPQSANGNDHAVAHGLRPPRPKGLKRLTIEHFSLTTAVSHTPLAAPVIFYRLRGDPTFTFLYLSHDIANLGYDRVAILSSGTGIRDVVHPHDQARFDMSMARLLSRDVEHTLVEFRLFARDGTCRWFENRCVAVRDDDGRLVEIEGILMQVANDVPLEQEFARRAFPKQSHEPAGRAAFIEYLERAFVATRSGATPFALLAFELGSTGNSHEGSVDSGHIRAVASLIVKATRPGDVVGRWTANQIIVLQRDVAEPADAAALAVRLQKVLRMGLTATGVAVNTGICLYSESGDAVGQMLTRLDVAVRRARARGHFCFYSDEMDRAVHARLALAEDLSTAIGNAEFELEYQPEIELSSGNIIGMEAMVRWHHPTRGRLLPDAFIPVAGRMDVMAALGRWILNEACRQMSLWRDEGVAPLVISINLSLFELANGDAFVPEVGQIIQQWRLPAKVLEFDVTEATLARLAWLRNDVLLKLRALGTKIAIDDFGNQFASFDYFRNYRVDYLKISRALIHKSSRDAESAATIRAIVRLANENGVGVIGQGVETEEQLKLLAGANRAAKAQGFHFSGAVKAAAASELLRTGNILRPTKT